ncbi:MAG: NgoFVII family restriction endonuclease [FCB group bacterium]|nr:NgoFVII family restriction endonuclease [FCB group bacterium]
MYTQSLFEQILINPASEGADELLIITGYASSAMAYHHIQALADKKLNVKINIIIGMCPEDGISLSNHRGFRFLVEKEYPDIFSCSYIYKPPPVHIKLYAWLKNTVPIKGFIGSANYSQKAFSTNQREAMDDCSATSIVSEYNKISPDSIYCNHIESDSFVRIYGTEHQDFQTSTISSDKIDLSNDIKMSDLEKIEVSLLTAKGDIVGEISGLNWGQRSKRDPNQAYIPLNAPQNTSGFFPQIGKHFTVLTDDGFSLICTREQDFGKAITTPQKNSHIGEYFRMRLSLANGSKVSKRHLDSYGRTSVTFYKLDDETYYMDFSV